MSCGGFPEACCVKLYDIFRILNRSSNADAKTCSFGSPAKDLLLHLSLAALLQPISGGERDLFVQFALVADPLQIDRGRIGKLHSPALSEVQLVQKCRFFGDRDQLGDAAP